MSNQIQQRLRAQRDRRLATATISITTTAIPCVTVEIAVPKRHETLTWRSTQPLHRTESASHRIKRDIERLAYKGGLFAGETVAIQLRQTGGSMQYTDTGRIEGMSQTVSPARREHHSTGVYPCKRTAVKTEPVEMATSNQNRRNQERAIHLQRARAFPVVPIGKDLRFSRS